MLIPESHDALSVENCVSRCKLEKLPVKLLGRSAGVEGLSISSSTSRARRDLTKGGGETILLLNVGEGVLDRASGSVVAVEVLVPEREVEVRRIPDANLLTEAQDRVKMERTVFMGLLYHFPPCEVLSVVKGLESFEGILWMKVTPGIGQEKILGVYIKRHSSRY